LPGWDWVGRIADLLGIAEWVYKVAVWLGVFAIVNSALGWLLGRRVAAPPARTPPREQDNDLLAEPTVYRQQNSRIDVIRTAVIEWIIRPDVPLGEDIFVLAVGYSGWIVGVGVYVLFASGSDFPLAQLLEPLLLYGAILLSVVLIVRTARLFWKIEYLTRRER
jgi:hypothetical protein